MVPACYTLPFSWTYNTELVSSQLSSVKAPKLLYDMTDVLRTVLAIVWAPYFFNNYNHYIRRNHSNQFLLYRTHHEE